MFLFCSVPQWYPVSPYLAPALLVGQLKERGFNAESLDLNVEFFNDILTNENVAAAYDRAKAIAEGRVEYRTENDPAFSAKLERSRKLRKDTCRKMLETTDKRVIDVLLSETEESVGIMKDKKDFYDPEKLFRAKDIISKSLFLLSLPYYPAEIKLDNYFADNSFTYDFADIDYQCKNREVNMFLPYFEKKLEGADLDRFKFIGLSFTDLSQVVPGLTLARLLKQRTNAKIGLGGNYIYKISEALKKIPKLFKEYCDFLTIGDGEIAAVELAEYVAGERKIEDVHSLIYFENGSVVENPTAPLLDLEKVAYPDFEGYDFSKYFSPETVIPVQLGKGCYWGKCTFCDFYTGQQCFDMKSVKRAVDEVEFLSKKYESTHFNFVDEAVPPAFYNRFATEVKERGLKIDFYSFARLEKAFSFDVLKNLSEAGAKFFMWGYEAESERVMKLMNKGIDYSERKRILRDSTRVGLWNHCTFLLCYPTETPEELQSTIDVIYDRELVNSCTPSNFAFKKNALLRDNFESAKITDFQENGQLHISYKYHSSVTTMEEIKRVRNAFEKKFLEDTADRLWAHTFSDSDYILLYLSHYGRDRVKNYRLKYKGLN